MANLKLDFVLWCIYVLDVKIMKYEKGYLVGFPNQIEL